MVRGRRESGHEAATFHKRRHLMTDFGRHLRIRPRCARVCASSRSIWRSRYSRAPLNDRSSRDDENEANQNGDAHRIAGHFTAQAKIDTVAFGSCTIIDSTRIMPGCRLS
ncbi:Uncharacterised protein [Kluyvera cryocrescens]|uniref:Uncharacterized protein n=1 Tax=Kluyvera cryocrescens TaxID=580 RepID=A0A485AQF3_KLUCR|nr:Uncharacterised protein [Kluyvera cryocrescens]